MRLKLRIIFSISEFLNRVVVLPYYKMNYLVSSYVLRLCKALFPTDCLHLSGFILMNEDLGLITDLCFSSFPL